VFLGIRVIVPRCVCRTLLAPTDGSATWYFLFRESKFGANSSYALNIPIAENLQVMPVVLMFALTIVSMVVTSWLTRPPSKETLQKFFPEP